MNLKRFIKEKGLNLICFIIIISIINIYLICINSFQSRYEDLLYLDFLIILVYLIFFIVNYNRWSKKFRYIYDNIEDKIELEYEKIAENSLEEELLKKAIKKNNEIRIAETQKYKASLQEMDEYIAKWVHEIKLPISALNIVVDRIDDSDLSSSVKNEVEKINYLVNSALYGSRTNSAEEDIFIKEEKLDYIIKKSIKNNAFFLIRNHVEVVIKELNYEVYTDTKWIIYVIDQIINNAIKYVDNIGKIEFYAKDEDKLTILCIKDYGIGITQEDIGRVFNKGFTGSNGRNKVYKSTGMGMYFSKKIIDKLGHEIKVNSEEGEFTEFQIFFYKISDYLKSTKCDKNVT